MSMAQIYTMPHRTKPHAPNLSDLTPRGQVECIKGGWGLWGDWWRHESYKYRESGAFIVMESDQPDDLADKVSDLHPDKQS